MVKGIKEYHDYRLIHLSRSKYFSLNNKTHLDLSKLDRSTLDRPGSISSKHSISDFLPLHTSFKGNVNKLVFLSPYLTGMRRVRDGFVNRFAKPLRTVAKRLHGIAKSSHASGTCRERVAKVLNM